MDLYRFVRKVVKCSLKEQTRLLTFILKIGKKMHGFGQITLLKCISKSRQAKIWGPGILYQEGHLSKSPI